MDLKLNIKTEQSLIKYKLKREKDLEDFFNKKKKEKEKEWNEQIEKAKWKLPVQDYEKIICKNGHKLVAEVSCGKCHETLYWVNTQEKFVICKGCNTVKKITDEYFCGECGAEAVTIQEYEDKYKPQGMDIIWQYFRYKY